MVVDFEIVFALGSRLDFFFAAADDMLCELLGSTHVGSYVVFGNGRA